MPPLYLGLHMSVAGGVSHALDRAAAVGSNAVQIFTKNNRQWKGPPLDEEDIARWRAEMPARGIERAVSHASYLINLATPKNPLWRQSIAAHADELRRARAYGVPSVVLHPGAHTGSGVDAAIERIAAALNKIHAQTPECGPENGNVRTLLEVMAGQGTVMGRNFDELRRIIEAGGRASARRCLRGLRVTPLRRATSCVRRKATPRWWTRSSARLAWRRLAAGTSTTASTISAATATATPTSARAVSATRGFRHVINEPALGGHPPAARNAQG